MLASASIAGVALSTFSNALLVLSMPSVLVVFWLFWSWNAIPPPVDASAAPSPKRVSATGAVRATSCTLVKRTAAGRKGTPVTACVAGCAPVVFVKLPTVAATPFSASEKTCPAELFVVVKLRVNPFASIETNEAS